MSKIVLTGAAAREAILRGVDFIVVPVAMTEGPRGRNCLLGQRALGQSPKSTRDGVSVCNYVDPSDPFEQIGADLIREACQKTDNAVGDGTTATAVLASAMIHEGFKLIGAGANSMAMERGIRKAADAIINQIRKTAVPIEGDGVFRVATVSAHGDETIGRLVAEAMQKAGKDGVVTAEPSSTSETFVQSVAGLELDKSNLISTAFITSPERIVAELPDCRVLLWEGVISTAKSLVPLLQQIHKDSVPVLICAGGYEQEALACIINNKVKLALPLIAVRLEAYGESRKELMRDIAALTGGKAFTEDLGMKLENVKVSELGCARKVTTDMRKTQILEGKGNQAELAGRVDSIRAAIETAVGPEKVLLRSRLAALLGGITILRVGGTTVTEMEEKKDRVIDAMSAAKAAIESGVVSGGGVALLRAVPAIYGLGMKSADEESAGLQVVVAACHSVVQQIAENSGIDRTLMLNQLLATESLGYNAMTGTFENLISAGIVDPAKVVEESFRNAVAVACSILTTGAVVAERVEEKSNG